MNKLATINLGTGELVQFDPKKTAYDIHGNAKAAEIAETIKDPRALEQALTNKLENEREFAGIYRTIFPATKLGKSKNARSGILPDQFCKTYGFSQRTVQRWCDRLLDLAKFDQEKGKILKRCKELAEMWQSASFSSDSVEWYTPPKYIESVREVLGEIDLDPASSELANLTVQASRIFTARDNGLVQSWNGRFFMNPPYGKKDGASLAGIFCQKAISEYQAGHGTGIILVNSVHSQKWQAPLYDFPVCFVDHRIEFVSRDGEKNNNPTFQNIFVYLGKNRQKFTKVFSAHGYVMEKIRNG